MPRVPKIDYLKCKQCRKDRQKCLPRGRIWPGARCDRCEKYNYRCSENRTKEMEACTGGIEDTVEMAVESLDVAVGAPSSATSPTVDVPSTPLDDPVPLIKTARGLNECLEELSYLEWLLNKWKPSYKNLEWASLNGDPGARIFRDTESVYQKILLEVVNLYLTAGEHHMIEVPPSQIIGRHFLSHFPSPESRANFPNRNYLSTLSKVVATLAEKGDFLAAQILQERVLRIITEISTGNGVLMAKAVPTLVELYQKSSDRLKFLCARLGLTIPGVFLVAPFLEQAISQNNRLLTSTSMDHWPEYTSIDGQSVIHYAAGSNADASLEVLLRIGLYLDCRDCTEGTPLQFAARKGYLKVVKMLVGDRSIHIGPISVLDENGSGFLATEGGPIFRSADVNADPGDFYGKTALQAAAENGHLEVVKFLISESADVNGDPADEDGRTALQAAAENGHLEIVKFLISESADVNADPAQFDGITALQAAAENGHLEIVKFLILESADVNANPADLYGRTALQGAAESGHFEVVKFLIAESADVNAVPGTFGRTALQAAAENGHLEVVKFLISESADVNADPEDFYGKTALQAAAENGHLEVVKFLISESADVNAVPAECGKTALQAAGENGYLEVVKFLISESADVNAVPAEYGRTALQAAAENGHLEVVKFLISESADVNAVPGTFGRTALQAAAENGHLEIVKFLILESADVNANPADLYGRTALQGAAESGHFEVVKFLIAESADVNAVPATFGRTALQAAAGNGHLEVVKFLIAESANVNATNGRTALQAAAGNGHLEAVALLLLHGAIR